MKSLKTFKVDPAINNSKHIWITYNARAGIYEYRLVEMIDGVCNPIFKWKKGRNSLEVTKTLAIDEYGDLTITHN